MAEPQHLKKHNFINNIHCEDCGNTCERKVTWTLINYNHETLPPWWKGACSCGRVRHPITKQWRQPNTPKYNLEINKQLRALNPKKPGPKVKKSACRS